MASRQMSRTPPPRQLQANESLEYLSQWKTAFKTFYKRDDCFKMFFKTGTQWNPSHENYGLQEEPDDDRRNAADLSEDLKDLLNTGRLLTPLIPDRQNGSTLKTGMKCMMLFLTTIMLGSPARVF